MASGPTKTTIQIPLGTVGLETKRDVRLRKPPSLDIARDVVFEQVAGLQTRPPFALMPNGIVGDGALANCRRLGVVNGELVLFTADTMYSWNAAASAWVSRGTHLAVTVDETAVFATTGDQIDGDRAELAGTIVYAWTEGTRVFGAAIDKATGSVLASPTAVPGGFSGSVGRPRLVALSARILLFVAEADGTLTARSLNPASPAAGFVTNGIHVAAGTLNAIYDVARAGTQDLVVGAYRTTSPTTTYTVFTVTAGLIPTAADKARRADGPIAVAATPDGTQVQLVRTNGANIVGDLINTSTLADVFTNQAIGTADGTPVNQIAAAYRTVQNGGALRCYAIWSAQENATASTWTSRINWADTANTLGTAAVFIRHLGVASRAFDVNGTIFVWLAFAGTTTVNTTGPATVPQIALQNTYFLYRDDGFLVAKSISTQAGGFAPSTGRLPNVQQTAPGVYSWCATKRRKIDLDNGGRSFAAREPVDVTITLDSNDARRCDTLGLTLYIAGGEILQYDGTRITEVGHHVYPWVVSLIDAQSGSIAPGTYAYKLTYRSQNARGETDRSTTATIGQITVTGSSVSMPAPLAPLTATHKLAVPPAAEVWRTKVAALQDSPFFLVSSNDPTVLTNPNRYLPNDPTAPSLPTFNDFLSDASIAPLEANPENEGILENLVPPPARLIIATDTRLFLGGVAGDPNRIWYSKLRNNGEIAAFHEQLTVDVPPFGGRMTALFVQDDVLYVGRESALYALPGIGFDNFGAGQNYGSARIVARDVGPTSQDALVFTLVGTMFKSAKGWQLLERSGATRYVGGAVAAFDSDTVLAMHVVTGQHQVRVLTNSRMLLWDYRGAADPQSSEFMGQWSEWSISDGLHAVVWNGQYVYLTPTGPKIESALSLTSTTYGLDVETAWIDLADVEGFAKVLALMPLGEFRSPCLVRVRVARDYQYDANGVPAYYDDKAWSPSPAIIGSALQFRHTPSGSNGNCEAIKVRLTAVSEAARASLATTSLAAQVTTSVTAWSASWSATAAKPGEMGNAVRLVLTFERGVNLVDVRDHFVWTASVGRWIEAPNRVGVRVACQPGSLTVAQLEAAIAAATSLVTLTTPDAAPAKTINAAGMAGLVATGALTGGAYGPPTGEAIRLTVLGLEVALRAGLYKRLPAAQKQ